MIKFLLTIALVVATILLGGVVFQDLWAWFIAPVFGLTLLTFGQAVGLGVVLSYLRLNLKRGFDENNEAIQPVAAVFVGLLVFWAFAAIVHLFV